MIMKFGRLKMKTNEFKRRLEDSGFSVELIGANLKEFQILYDGFPRGYILEDFPYQMNTTYYFKEMEDNLRILLLDTMYEYARTPVEERKEESQHEKKYRIKHKWLSGRGLKYLCYDKLSYVYFLSEEPLVSDEVTSEFTQEHINSIKRKFNTSLEDFDIVEVK